MAEISKCINNFEKNQSAKLQGGERKPDFSDYILSKPQLSDSASRSQSRPPHDVIYKSMGTVDCGSHDIYGTQAHKPESKM